MRYSLKLSLDAEHDLFESYSRYESKMSGLGERFLLNIDNALDEIRENPKLFQVRFNKNVRGYTVSNFPYLILYILKNNSINVIAVLNTNRNPANWINLV